jgi:hypothetical protein
MLRKFAIIAALLLPLAAGAQQPVSSPYFQGQVYYGAPPCNSPITCPAVFAQVKLTSTSGCFGKFVLQQAPGQNVSFMACSDQFIASTSECGTAPISFKSTQGPVCPGMSVVLTIGYTSTTDLELLAYDASGKVFPTPIHLEFNPDGSKNPPPPPPPPPPSGDSGTPTTSGSTYTTDPPTTGTGTYTTGQAATKPVQPTAPTKSTGSQAK